MLSLGLTGGIAAGKSLLANRFRELGAVVIDADQLAREVVAPGSPGLAAVVERFGRGILLPDGSLDRPKLGSIVFADDGHRLALNAIVHPLVRSAADSLKFDAGPGAIVVQDIPLLVESGQGANFHLVVVVQAPREERIARMVRDRGMSEADAMARMSAQASDDERAAVADVLIHNDGSPERAVAQLDAVWHQRLVPFAANMAAGTAAAHGDSELEVGVPGDKDAALLRERLVRAVGDLPTSVEPTKADGDRLVFGLRPQGASTDVVKEVLAVAGFFPCAELGSSGDSLGFADPAVRAYIHIED
ncbi:dephospho-CoA kinase [Arthrobacter alpinus]|uniref:dephospho-CoA kinase n=1 Tax=Arthrobacter alpinus TaxID=656366 RepID=UPI0009F96C33|nr:dephospho-CoA kinase [Arthrobacter alpinus]